VFLGAYEDGTDVYNYTGSVAITGSTTPGSSFHLYGPRSYTLSAGSDYNTYTVGNETQTYLDVFGDTETITIDYVLSGPSNLAKANALINLANIRKDCITFISPQRSDVVGANASTTAAQAENVTKFFEAISDSSSYAVFDNNYKYIYDRFNDQYRYIPTNADMAGLCVNTTAVSEAWYSPAGFNRGNLRNAIKIAFNPNKAQRDDLYANRVNPIVSFPGQGIVLFGDKTALRSPSAFDRINVRRLFLILERTVKNFSRNVLFELNDETTRLNFSTQVNNYMRDIQARRGMTDFLIVADTSNNTPDVIDRNEFVADIYIKPSRSINFITLTFVATRSGVSFNEVIGRV
jgi:phage tail sheath protein FI